MRPVTDGLAIAPRSTVQLKPGGTHIMLTGLRQRLSAGDTIALTLSFERSGNRPIAIRVLPAGDEGGAHDGMRM
jgi:copper(I)-binding protein